MATPQEIVAMQVPPTLTVSVVGQGNVPQQGVKVKIISKYDYTSIGYTGDLGKVTIPFFAGSDPGADYFSVLVDGVDVFFPKDFKLEGAKINLAIDQYNRVVPASSEDPIRTSDSFKKTDEVVYVQVPNILGFASVKTAVFWLFALVLLLVSSYATYHANRGAPKDF